ncbi:hypothetical protein [Shewanella sp.]|uniref:hypothetical protein n=1 Tax=Shewanella sp. TaxID=50422 RepID=UPI00356338DD
MSAFILAPAWARSVSKLCALYSLMFCSFVSASDYQALMQKAPPSTATEKSTQSVHDEPDHAEPGHFQLGNHSQLADKPAALDSQGNPLVIPAAPSPGLEFSGRDYVDQSQKSERSSKRTPRRESAAATASRPYVADDPNCRWLDNRMGQLEKLLTSRGAGEHHGDELKARQKEWRCLKCGSNGPRQGDHDRCMYRR